MRLITWALLTGKEDARLPLSVGALRPIIEAIAARRKAMFGAKKTHLAEVELDVTVSLAARFGFALGRELFGRALGRPAIAPDVFAHRLATMLLAAMSAEPEKGRT